MQPSVSASVVSIAVVLSTALSTTLSPATFTAQAFQQPRIAAVWPARATAPQHISSQSPSALQAWFLGGEEVSTTVSGDTPEEMVKVRIERTSANSRRIGGEIVVNDTPLEDVWAILTDYDRLSIHVPNLIESKVTSTAGAPPSAVPGDGSYKCRLYQKGAQKIVGFDFSATVTMDMTEQNLPALDAKQISFKCVDSPFFKEFDGTWKVQEIADTAGRIQTLVSYVVDVRPKGPVPVAALEWRIREDVPINLRAVKAASLKEGLAGVLAAQAGLPPPRQLPVDNPDRVSYRGVQRQFAASRSDWDYDETMAKYL